jgi:hypothetical protein
MHIAHLSFRHFPRLLALFRPFSSYFNVASHASNKCLLPIFLSVTFLALLALFPPIFTPHLNLAGHYLINAYGHLSFRHFLTLLTLFPRFFPSLSTLFPPFFRTI